MRRDGPTARGARALVARAAPLAVSGLVLSIELAMKIRRNGGTTTIELSDEEVDVLKRVLERASFIDTPVEDQPRIAAFASRALDDLADVR